MPRLAALLVPLFPLAARLRAEPALAGEAVAVCEGDGTGARVAAASRPARRAGIRAGMTLAQARGILPDLIARGQDPLCEASATGALLEVAGGLSPRIEDAGPGLALADVEGMEELFPGPEGEERLGHAAIRAAGDLDLPLRVGIAGTRLAAVVAARLPDSPTVVPPGGEAAFLAARPLKVLGLPDRLRATLRRWGVETVGGLARLPAGEIGQRLGAEGRAAWRAARGEDPRPLVPAPPSPVLEEGMELEWPLLNLHALTAVLEELVGRSMERLRRLGAACTLLELELGLEPAGHDRRSVRLPSPSTDTYALVGILRLELEKTPPEGPVAAVRCLIHPDEPRRAQLNLFGPREVSPGALATALARATARLGPENVGSPRVAGSHVPGRYTMEPFDPPPPPGSRPEPQRARGLLAVRTLRPPVPLEVLTQVRAKGEGVRGEEFSARREDNEHTGCSVLSPHTSYPTSHSPRSLATPPGAAPRISGAVRVAAGPWRCEEGWWSGAAVDRDYWDVELNDGRIYRIFHDTRKDAWYADGVYD